MAVVPQATSTPSNPPAVRKPPVVDAGFGFYARKFEIPEEEKPHLPCAINIIEEMMTDPQQLTCSLSLALFEDPVMDLVGHTYERKNIQQHFDQQQEKGLSLTTPLTNETLEARTLIPNRAKKSELEEYKTDNARKCFQLAQQCLERKCGESALLLVDRVKQLNPKLEGLAAIEEKARETFISVQKQKEAYIRRAEKALQEERPQEALRLLIPFLKPVTYLYTPSQEPSWVIPGSKFVGIRSHFLVTHEKPDYYTENYTLWDIKTKTSLVVCNARNFHASKMEMPIENVIELTSTTGETLLMFTNGKSMLLDRESAQNKHPYINNPKIGDLCRKVTGNWVVRVPEWEASGVLGYIHLYQLIGVRWTTVYRDRLHRPYGDDEWVEEGEKFFMASLIYPDGTEKGIGDSGQWFKQTSPYMMPDLIKREEFLQQYFPQISKSVSSTLSPEMSPSACSPSIEWRERKSEDNNVHIDRWFPTGIEQQEGVKFYTLLLHAAVAQDDFDAYLYAIKYLVIWHQKAGTWKVLEETMVGLGDRTQPFKERLVREIEKATALKEDFWVSRFHLFLGLLQVSLTLKLATYKKGLQSYPTDAVLKEAVQYVKILPLVSLESKAAPSVGLESYQLLQRQVQEQQKQIEKLQELVQSLLHEDPKK